jgi:hypothetical protein
VVSFMSWPFYSQGKNPRYPLDRRLGGVPEPVWTLWSTEKCLDRAGNRTPNVEPLARLSYAWTGHTVGRAGDGKSRASIVRI